MGGLQVKNEVREGREGRKERSKSSVHRTCQPEKEPKKNITLQMGSPSEVGWEDKSKTLRGTPASL